MSNQSFYSGRNMHVLYFLIKISEGTIPDFRDEKITDIHSNIFQFNSLTYSLVVFLNYMFYILIKETKMLFVWIFQHCKVKFDV